MCVSGVYLFISIFISLSIGSSRCFYVFLLSYMTLVPKISFQEALKKFHKLDRSHLCTIHAFESMYFH